jgi:archaellum biogenesis ATPase FlaH
MSSKPVIHIGERKLGSKSSVKHDMTARQLLHEYSLTGCSKELRKQMLDQKFVLADVALLGQWTTIYSSPNTGKTLLTLWMLNEALAGGQINGDEVFYVNADDTFRGVVEKTELAEQWGFHMITPNQNGFTSRVIIDLMVEMAERDGAKGVVIVLDTLKKFTDLMHKKEASEFGAIAREFVSAGGTLIVLAHVNKHRAADGRPVYAGTSDIRDDSDCVFIMDLIDGERYQGVMTVEMTADKVRGDVADRVCLQYNSIRGQSYADLIGSVKRIDRDYLESVKAQRLVEEKLVDDQPVIDAVIRHIDAGIKSKSKLVSAVNADTGVSHAKIRKVLLERTGGVFDLGHRWCVQIGAHNKQKYAVLPKQ